MGQLSFTITEVAELRKVSENQIEDSLRQGLLFCSVRLSTTKYKELSQLKLDTEFVIPEELKEEMRRYFDPIGLPLIRIKTVDNAKNERRDDEFILLNYDEAFEDSTVDLKKAVFKKFRDDGLVYRVFIRSRVPPLEKKDLFISSEEVERFNKESTDPELAKQRHVIQPEEQKAKGKGPIQLAIEAYLNESPDGNKAGFYTFLKAKIKLTTGEILKDDEGYDIFFKGVKESGSKEGVYLNQPKQGKKEGEPGYNHYSGADITTLISREKGARKKMSD